MKYYCVAEFADREFMGIKWHGQSRDLADCYAVYFSNEHGNEHYYYSVFESGKQYEVFSASKGGKVEFSEGVKLVDKSWVLALFEDHKVPERINSKSKLFDEVKHIGVRWMGKLIFCPEL